ncbi:MAG: DNA helicase, partial [Pseudomonadota bacterium]
MAERDAERIELAEQIRRELAIENEISSIQARSFVRCLQTTWDVDTIAWGDRDSNSQLSDARRLLHAAHIFQEIQGPESVGAMDCYRRAGELLEWMTRSDDSVRTLVPIEILASAAYQLGKLPAMASGLLSQVSIENQGVALYAAFLRADFDGVLSATNNFWAANPDLTTRDAGQLLSHGDVSDRVGADIDPVAWLFTVELVRSLGLIADTLRTGNVSRFEQARKKLEALAQMALRTLSEDAALIVSLLQQVTESYAR